MYQEVSFYLPHKSPMILLDKVIQVTKEGCICQTDISEHSSVAAFIENGKLDNIFAVEFMAQCIGVWSGYNQRQAGCEQIKKGMLVAIRNAICYEPYYKVGQSLISEVNLELIDNNFGCFECKLTCEDKLLASAIISTYQIDD